MHIKVGHIWARMEAVPEGLGQQVENEMREVLAGFSLVDSLSILYSGQTSLTSIW